MSKLSCLKQFAADRDLKRLDQMLAEFDAFALLGLSKSEEAHSKILAWLLNPQANHSASDFFLTNFLLETKAATNEQVQAINWSETSIQREWRNVIDGRTGFLDILILNTEALFACAIENKIFSIEHDEQLTRYRQVIEQEYGNSYRSYLFVSPQGIAAQRPDERRFWKPVNYGTILRLVEMTIECGVDRQCGAIISFLQQYATTLRRRIVPDTSLKRLAAKIYLRHREAIDLIHRYKNSYYYLDYLNKICSKAIELRESWRSLGERDGGKLMGFIDTGWKKYSFFNTGTGWLPHTDTGPLLFLDFDFREFGQITLLLTIATADSENVRKLLFDKTQGQHPGIFNHRDSPRGGYRKTTIRLYASKPILSESDFIDGDVESWHDTVTKWISDFAQNEFPNMNEIILNSFREIESELEHQKVSIHNS